MRKITRFLMTVAVAASLLALGGGVERASAQEAVQEGISDERVKELARGYYELLHDGKYDQLWQHLAPQAKQRFGTLEEFRRKSAGVMERLGTEALMVEEIVEPARVGMVAHKVYHRISRYSGVEGSAVRMTIGLVNDGTIGGLNAQPIQ